MGKISREVSGLVSANKGLKMTQQKTKEWYKNTLNSTGDHSISRTTGMFSPGKIYIFRYENPITEDLSSWDLNPIVLSLGRESGKDIGINLNLIPYGKKLSLLDKIYSVYENKIDARIKSGGGSAIKEGGINELNHELIKPFLIKAGITKAVRTYHTNRRKSTAVISYADWKRVPLLDLVKIKIQR